MEPKVILYIAFGLATLGLTWLPDVRHIRYIGTPIIYVLLAALLFSLPLNLPVIDPIANTVHSHITEYLTELIVIVSLAGAGLAIDCPFRFKAWASTWWLLGVAMPLSIGAAVVLGQYLFGLSLAASVLLGALLAPTDPVLAASVQVGPPNQGGEDPVRFSLTTEAGLNDGLAFPFVYLAMGLAEHASVGGWLVEWFFVDLLYRVGAGILLGIGVGWIISHYVFHYSDETNRAETQEGLMVMATIFLAYGLAEMIHGYGFLAVFAAAVAGRQNVNKADSYHQKPYQFADQMENILLGFLLLALGGFIATSTVQLGSVNALVFAGLFLLVVRPLAGMISLRTLEFRRIEKRAIAFLGIRGFGSFYYLAYAQNHGSFEDMGVLWQITTVVILASLLIHGGSATFAMRKLDSKGHLQSSLPPS
ncbi:cation:proton antiporter [Nodosilinea sp. LEGE 07088]|uniref:cation:proton antiporter n=1 Tax=Nodosilinea sp. LEGE 07088 TaxID=2777968 RepID=UPI00187E44AF|nr:cation:proton antiporter [Nodosilinea sp. LEGE 07088]MBE9137266.1 cation:proton antiporter [Nodosilinea sp. LEGE 07088]